MESGPFEIGTATEKIDRRPSSVNLKGIVLHAAERVPQQPTPLLIRRETSPDRTQVRSPRFVSNWSKAQQGLVDVNKRATEPPFDLPMSTKNIVIRIVDGSCARRIQMNV
jgi:hypothetical protein